MHFDQSYVSNLLLPFGKKTLQESLAYVRERNNIGRARIRANHQTDFVFPFFSRKFLMCSRKNNASLERNPENAVSHDL